jgi:outer membrane lipoprotein SlyB
MQVTKLTILITLIASIVGCASSQKAGIYQTGQVQSKMKVVLATVIDIRDVEIEATPTGAGAASGAAVGAIAGSNVGQGKGTIVGSVAGAVVGGVAGTVAEKALGSKKGIEIIYRPDGATDTLALVQEKDDRNAIGIGDRIRILEGQFNARAVKLAAGTSVTSSN